MKSWSSLFVIALMSVGHLVAQTPWRIDKAHSQIKFTVTHMLVSEVDGIFKDYDVIVAATKDDFTDASIEATIKAASINTENERRDNDLRSDSFFNSERFPEITFKSTSFEKVGEKQYKIHGDLTIRDVTKKVTFNATNTGTLKTSRGLLSGWKAELTINRFDYGLKYNRAIETGGLAVSQDVKITVTLRLNKPSA
ncbi:MAG: YceI family protein [Bacteroidota bacterium]